MGVCMPGDTVFCASPAVDCVHSFCDETARGCVTVEINPDRTVLSSEVTHRLAGNALEIYV